MRHENIKIGDIVKASNLYGFVTEKFKDGTVVLNQNVKCKVMLDKVDIIIRMKTNDDNTKTYNTVINDKIYSFNDDNMTISDITPKTKPYSLGLPRTHRSIPDNIKSQIVKILNKSLSTQVSR